jgi:hypothetical protein
VRDEKRKSLSSLFKYHLSHSHSRFDKNSSCKFYDRGLYMYIYKYIFIFHLSVASSCIHMIKLKCERERERGRICDGIYTNKCIYSTISLIHLAFILQQRVLCSLTARMSIFFLSLIPRSFLCIFYIRTRRE